jgi:CheY-like chemotaxis protein
MEAGMTKILLVEDDKNLREIYGVRLLAEGYEISSAGDGEEALAMAVKEKPDLIISDVMMPKISGFDMLDILRSTPETKNIKVIMMTALSSEDQRARGEALGANRYLVKSQVGIEDVVRTVHDVLGDAPLATKPSTASAFGPALAVAPMQNTQNVVPAPVAQPQPTIQQDIQPNFNQQPVAAPQTIAVNTANNSSMPAAMPNTQSFSFPQTNMAQQVGQPTSEQTMTAQPILSETRLPQPTAPFSSPAPASLGDEFNSSDTQSTVSPSSSSDISSRISQELGGYTATNSPVEVRQIPPTQPQI